MKYYSPQNNKGFTLIEIIVASAIFAIVMLVAMGAVLSSVNANRKAQSLNAIINNLSFAFESMIREIRTGKDYVDCSGAIPNSCVNFEDKSGRDVTYEFASGRISKMIGSDDQGNVSGEEVTLETVSFEIKGQGSSDGPERILLHIQGYAGANKTKSDFNIETLITSRSLDVSEFQ